MVTDEKPGTNQLAVAISGTQIFLQSHKSLSTEPEVIQIFGFERERCLAGKRRLMNGGSSSTLAEKQIRDEKLLIKTNF